MITQYEMSTGEVLSTDGEAPELDWALADVAKPVAQPRLQTIDEARAAESMPPATIPADLIGVSAARILARFS